MNLREIERDGREREIKVGGSSCRDVEKQESRRSKMKHEEGFDIYNQTNIYMWKIMNNLILDNS